MTLRPFAVLALCAALIGPLLAPSAAPFFHVPEQSDSAPAHDDESGECPETAEASSEDADAKHPAPSLSVAPAVVVIHRERGSSDEPRHRDEKPLLPPPNK